MMGRHPPLLIVLLLGFGFAAHTQPTNALTPEELFERASPSIVVVQVYSGTDKPEGLGSGVVIRNGSIVTNCHVVFAGDRAYVVQKGKRFATTPGFADRERDLCLLTAPGVTGPRIELVPARTVKPGARVFAIGSPRGLELTITEGLISGLRSVNNSEFLQNSAPISPGSSGGGLFDTSGRLVGITTSQLKDSQNLNFALPADWVGQLRERSVSETERFGRAAKAISDQPVPASYANLPSLAPWLDAMSSRMAPFIANPAAARDFLATVHYESTRAGLDPQLVLGLIEALSRFHKYEISKEGARGYMQVMPIWTVQLGTPGANLFHLRTNLRFGCVILRHYLDRYDGDLFKTINAYRNQTLGRPDGFAVDSQQFAPEVMVAAARWQYRK